MSIDIRPVTPADADAIHRLLTDPRNALRSRRPTTMPFADVEKSLAKPEPGARRMVATRSGELVGYATLQQWLNPRLVHTGQIMLLLARDGDEDVERRLFDFLLDLGQRWMGLRRFAAEPLADDARFLALLSHAGFERVVTEQDACFIDGQYRDRFIYDRIDASLAAGPQPTVIGPTAPSSGDALPITLRPPRLTDAPQMAELMRFEESCAGTMQLPSRELSAYRERLEKSDANVHRLIAEVDGKIVGEAGLHGDDRTCDRHTFAFFLAIHPHYWGRRIAQTLTQACLDLADGSLNAHRVELAVYAHNPAAVRVYEKLGFVREGAMRRQAFCGGAFGDSICMARVRTQRTSDRDSVADLAATEKK